MARALSVQQPWAWLIVNGWKDVENRDWPTKVRGTVFIHAGKKFDDEAYHMLRIEEPNIPMPKPDAFLMGGIVGAVEVVGCATWSTSKWFSGKYAFVLRDPRTVPFQPLRGQLGFLHLRRTCSDQRRPDASRTTEVTSLLARSPTVAHNDESAS